jgi:hypothetical protein
MPRIRAAAVVLVLPADLALPGLGVVPINAFLPRRLPR